MRGSVDIAIGLGSNVGPAEENIHSAIACLCEEGLELVRISSMYETSPVGPQDQPWFTNAVARMRTALPPLELLELCKKIEEQVGRAAGGTRWGPRVIDLDILLYGKEQVNAQGLTAPHPEIGNRLFALVPLLEVAADMRMPGGATVKRYAEARIQDLKRAGQKIQKKVEIE